MIADTYHAFENYIAKIFKKAGFSITQNVPVSEIKNSGDIDIVAVKDEKEYHAQDSERYSGNMTSDITNRNTGTLEQEA